MPDVLVQEKIFAFQPDIVDSRNVTALNSKFPAPE